MTTDHETSPQPSRWVDLERVYAAPRERVFAAWTDPDQVAQWWGPDGFDAPREKLEIDLRVGGRFAITMVVRDPEIAAGMGVDVGAEFPDHTEIVELVEPELLVLRAAAQPEFGLPVETVNRIEFHAEGDSTRVVVRSGPYTDEMGGHAEAGFSQQLEKLVTLLG